MGISSLSDVLLSYGFTAFEAVQLRDGEAVHSDQARTTHLKNGPGFWLYIFQVSKLVAISVSFPDSHGLGVNLGAVYLRIFFTTSRVGEHHQMS